MACLEFESRSKSKSTWSTPGTDTRHGRTTMRMSGNTGKSVTYVSNRLEMPGPLFVTDQEILLLKTFSWKREGFSDYKTNANAF